MVLKALVFSDVHGHDKGLAYIKSQVADLVPHLVLIAGDATDYQDPSASLKVYDQLDPEVFLVPGNMDRFGSLDAYKNVTNLHLIREIREGIGFVGLQAMDMGDLDLSAYLSDIVSPGDVLLTHFPSKGYNDRTRSGHHAGSVHIGNAVKSLKVLLHISGHIHESPGVVQNHGVYYVNPGPAYENRGVEIIFENDLQIRPL